MNNVIARLTIILASYSMAASADTIQFQYTVTDLGTFGGASAQSAANAINNQGEVVGWAADPTTGYFGNAFVWGGSNGTAMLNLGTLDGATTSVSNGVAIGNNGWVAGTSDSGSTTLGFLWTGSGSIQSIGTLGGASTLVYGMNNVGTIVGGSQTASGAAHGFVYSNGVMRDTGTLFDIAVNDSGQIAAFHNSGNGAGQAYLVSASGQARNIGSLGGTDTQPEAINDNGEIAGISSTAGNQTTHAFLYSGGKMTDLGVLIGGDYSQASGINDEGDVVGESDYDAAQDAHAFLYTGGQMVDLNSVIDPNSRWTLVNADAINDNGQIVGIGFSPNGDEHAFLLTPTPEPSTFVLLAVAGCSLLIFGLYRRRRMK